MKAISIRQPWAWLIVNGHKDIENRTWRTHHRGPLLIHASKGMSRADYAEGKRVAELASAITGKTIQLPAAHELQRGGVVGVASVVDCTDRHPSPWFFGDFGFVLTDAKPLPFQPCAGKLGFFEVQEVAHA